MPRLVRFSLSCILLGTSIIELLLGIDQSYGYGYKATAMVPFLEWLQDIQKPIL